MNLRRTPRLVAALGSTLALVTLTGAATGLTLRDIENIILRAHPLPPGILKGCPTPSLSICQAEMQTGGLCASSNRVACTTIIQDAFSASWDADRGAGGGGPPICHVTNNGTVCDPVGGLGLQLAILPPTMTRGGFLYNDVALEPFDLKALTSSGAVSSDLSYASIIQTADLPAVGVSLLELPNLTPRTPTQFTADGTSVRTCAEYVYKKNWDYVRFEEAALSCRTDWLCVYDAFARTGPSDFGLAKPTLYSNAVVFHDPTHIQVRWQPGQPLPAPQKQQKNGFFPDDVNPTIFTSALRAHTTGVEAAVISAALATNYAASYSYTDKVDFHIARHDAQVAETGGVGITLPEYKEHERRLATYAELLGQYRALRDADPTAVNSSLDPALFDACGNALSIDPVTGLPFPTKCKLKGPFKPKPGTAAAALAAIVDSLAAFIVTEWHHKSFLDGVTVDHGCLATDSTRCDWSPKQVATDYLHLGMTEREHDYAHCVVETAENFTTQFPSMDAKPGFSDARTDYNAFEYWMGQADFQRGEITKDIPWVGDDTLGTSKAGTRTIGDTDWFAASYDYEASWSVHVDKVVDPASGALKVKRICRSQGKATGKLVAKVWAVKQSFDVVDAYLNVRAGTAGVGGAAGDPSTAVTAKLYLLGDAIYAEKTTPAFDFAPEPKTNGIGHEEVVFVGPVPVTLGAKVDFSAGFTAHAGATAPQPADAACNFDDPAGVQIDANVTPYGRATAAAYGAIGGEFVGLGAEAGVEGHITLVDAKVPTSAIVKFGGHTKFDGSEVVPSVHVTLNTRLDLEFMSGGVVAYAEICYLVGCKRTEKPIFTWPGIRVGESIWTPLDKDFPIPALQVAVPPKPVPATP